MKRKLLIFVIAFSMSVLSYGQGEMDAFRNSKTELSGSARGMGMAGAFGALGGDITGVATNPAGIAVYRSSEVMATMNFSSNNVKTNWQGSIESDSKFKFNFDNIAYTGYFPLGNETVSSINFGFAYNRLKNFDRNYKSYGFGMKSSLSQFILEDATQLMIHDGIMPEDLDDTRKNYNPYRSSKAPWIDILGYNGFIIDYDNQGYFSYFPGSTDVEMNVQERGAIETYDFTVGTNFSEKLYLGLTFKLTDMHYSVSSLYREFYGSAGDDGFDLSNNLTEDGAGYQVTVGAIFKPVDALRIGLAYHSPTWYDMSRSFDAATEALYVADDVFKKAKAPSEDPYAVYDYKLQTPQRWVASVAGIIGTKAIVSLDYELTDYTAMDMAESNGYSKEFDDNDNKFINQDFRKASTVKVGAEYRLTPQLSIRAGYAWVQSPFTTNVETQGAVLGSNSTIAHYTTDGDASYITCGLGYKFTRNFYIDAAFVYRSQTDDLYYFPKYYSKTDGLLVNSTPAKFENKTYKGLLTFGYKF